MPSCSRSTGVTPPSPVCPRPERWSATPGRGEPRPAEVGERELAIVNAIRPKLLEDGVFLAAIDIVGGYLTEVNVFSPAGLGNASELAGVDFVGAVLDAVEAKAALSQERAIPNVALATLDAATEAA